MPASQSASNVLVAFKVQSGISAPASGAGASGLRVKPSQSLKLNKQYINSEEVRRDGMTTRGRQGSRSSSAGYASELSLGSFDALIEAALRGTFTVSTDITQATMTSVTTTTTTIVASAGSWLTQGVRRGDMIKLTGFADAANNAKWFRVISVTASTITVAGTAPLVLNATPDSTFTVTVAKNVIQGSPPVERYFSLEEYQQDIDSSLYGTDMKVVKMDFNAQPNRNIEVTFTFMGLDAQSLSGASSPTFTAPTYTTSLPMVMVDGTIRINGVDYTVLTGFQFSLDLGGQTTPTLSPTSVDVFLANAKLTGSFTAVRQDMTFWTAFSAETQVEFFVTCSENEADPKDFISFYIGNAALSDNSTAIASDGPMIATCPWTAGKDEAGTDHAATMIKVATSAP
jgi:hypothetical protein